MQPPHSCFCCFLSSSNIVPFTCACGAAHLRLVSGPVMHVGVHARTFHLQCAVEAPARLSLSCLLLALPLPSLSIFTLLNCTLLLTV